jgi:predicted nucleotidyltransferase
LEQTCGKFYLNRWSLDEDIATLLQGLDSDLTDIWGFGQKLICKIDFEKSAMGIKILASDVSSVVQNFKSI